MILKALRDCRERRAVERHAIPDALWELTLLRYPFLAQRSAADQAELRRLCSLFLADKEFHGAGGFEVTDEVAVAVAAQACLPVLRLGLAWYDGFVGIVMHEGRSWRRAASRTRTASCTSMTRNSPVKRWRVAR